MVALQGISGIPEPKPERPADVRERRDATPAKSDQVQDDVLISSEAQAAARISKLVQAAQADADIRADRVEAAKEHIARGDYKRPEIVAKVAERISKYLP